MRDEEGDESSGSGPVVVGCYVAVDREGMGSAAAGELLVGGLHDLDAALYAVTPRATAGYVVAGAGVRGSGG